MKRQALVVVAVGCLLYVAFLGTRDLWYADEPDIAEPAREMLLRGDWVTPTQNGKAWIDYPPLVYWLGMLASRVAGGMSEFALRLPSALGAILLALATWRFGAARLAPGTGLVAALALLTFPQFAFQATNVHVDMVFAVAQGLGLLLYAAAEPWTPGRAWAARVLAFLLFGLAFLAKGPLGLLLPGFVLTCWHVSLRQWRRCALLGLLTLVSLAVVVPWYLAVAQANGAEWVKSEFLAQSFDRFGRGTERGHARPWHYYLVSIWGDLGLWTVLLPVAIGWRFRTRVWADPMRRLVFLWCAAMLLFFNAAATKRQVYLLPLYPAFALLIGDLQPGRVLRALTRASAVGALGIVLVGIVGATLLRQFDDSARVPDLWRPILRALPIGAPLAFALVGLVSGGLLVRAWARSRPALGVAGMLVLQGGLWLAAMALVFPAINEVNSYRPHARWLAERVAPGESLGIHHPGEVPMRQCGFLYYGERPLQVLDTADALAAFLDEAPMRWAVVGEAPALRLLAQDPRFAGRERRRFAVWNIRWVVFGPP